MGSLFFTLLRRLNNITAGRNYLYAVLIEVLPERHIICYYRYIFFSGKIIPHSLACCCAVNKDGIAVRNKLSSAL